MTQHLDWHTVVRRTTLMTMIVPRIALAQAFDMFASFHLEGDPKGAPPPNPWPEWKERHRSRQIISNMLLIFSKVPSPVFAWQSVPSGAPGAMPIDIKSQLQLPAASTNQKLGQGLTSSTIRDLVNHLQ